MTLEQLREQLASMEIEQRKYNGSEKLQLKEEITNNVIDLVNAELIEIGKVKGETLLYSPIYQVVVGMNVTIKNYDYDYIQAVVDKEFPTKE